MTYKDIEKYTDKICSRYGLPGNLFAGSCSGNSNKSRFNINAQTDGWRKRLAQAKFAIMYIEEDDRYIVWENYPDRLTFYLSKKDYLAAQNCSTGFTLKGKGYKAWGEERVWVLTPEQLEQFIANIANQ